MPRNRSDMLPPAELEKFSSLNRGSVNMLVTLGVLEERGNSSILDVLVARAMKHTLWSSPSAFGPRLGDGDKRIDIQRFARVLSGELRKQFLAIYKREQGASVSIDELVRHVVVMLETGQVVTIKSESSLAQVVEFADREVWAFIPAQAWVREAVSLYPNINFERPSAPSTVATLSAEDLITM